MKSSIVVVALLVAASSARAQTTAGLVDEGTFTVTRAGAPIGTENFKIIRRLGAEGVEYLAQCTRTIGDRVVKTALTADSSGSATSYSRITTGPAPAQLSARRTVNRLTVDEQGNRTSSRDYMFGPGTLILDDDVIHHAWFVTRVVGRPLSYVVPNGRASGQGALSRMGAETLTIGGTSVAATRFAFGTGDFRREIWVDSDRRILKVSIPAQQIVAIRDLVPR